MIVRRHQHYLLLGSVMLNALLLVLLCARDAARPGDLLERMRMITAPPDEASAAAAAAAATGPCPIPPTYLSFRETARRLDEEQLRLLLETPSNLLDVQVLLKVRAFYGSRDDAV